MAVCRVERTGDYTTMSNHHLRNMEISLKAKGLLSVMLSLPDNWDYTIKGLSIINKEGLDSIRSTIHELEMAGYVERKRTRDPRGRFHTSEYIIREKPVSPVSEKPTLDIPTQVNPMSGIPTQISKEEIIKEKSITEEELAASVGNIECDKYDNFLSTDLLRLNYGYRNFDIVGAYEFLIKVNNNI